MTTFLIKNKKYELKDLSLLKNFNEKNLVLKPYPHIIIKNCLDKDIYEHLENTYPSDEFIFKLDHQKHEIPMKNMRYQINCNNSLKLNKIDYIWRLFIDYHTSEQFYIEVATKFNILQDKIKTVGKRNINDNDILLDCQIGINSISDIKSIVIGPHLDLCNKIYSGLFYMKQKNDNSLGGNLKIYDIIYPYNNLSEFTSIISKKNIFNNGKWDNKQIKVFKKIDYDKNVLVLFLNTKNSIHGVSPRDPNIYSRRLINIISEYNLKK